MTNPNLLSRGMIFSALLCACGAGALHAQQPLASVQVDAGDAALRQWVEPVYPEVAKKSKQEGNVEVDFVVDQEGRVTLAEVSDSTDVIFNEAALAAVRCWTFSPALEQGKPTTSGMTVPIEFRLDQLKQTRIMPARHDLLPRGMKLIPAKFKYAPDPEYPAELDEIKIQGEVLIEFSVDAEGVPRVPRIIGASHAAFVESALRALEHTRFEPARQGLLAKATTLQYPVQFINFELKRPELLAANHLSVIDEVLPDSLPMPYILFEPVYPYAQLLAGAEGSASVEFSLDDQGRTLDEVVVTASEPEFGAALLAAVQAWVFKPAMQGGVNTPVRMRVVHNFVPPMSGPVARLLDETRAEGSALGGAGGRT